MANPIRKLIGHTAIYGLSSMFGRLLNFLLVPLYTALLDPSEYGVVSELYAWVAFLVVFLSFGMETTYFHFLQKDRKQEGIFNQGLLTLISINLGFLLILLIAHQQIANALLFSEHVEYIILLGLVVVVDAIAALPMAKLRAEEKAKTFAAIQFTSILVNIGLNLFFLMVLFDPEHSEMGIIYILVANLISSLLKPLFLYKHYKGLRFSWNGSLAKEMVFYGFPLMLAGLAGIINETIDRILLKHLLFDGTASSLEYADTQVGIYSACYKLAMLITIFLQAYRYAAEPLFFSMSKDEDRNMQYRKIMNVFIAALSFMFLVVTLNIDFFKLFIRNEAYYEGLGVVPILLLANIFLGIYINQSIWYKLSGQTRFGAYISIGGASITLILNFILIPKMGYWAAAWVTLLVYGSQMVASYLLSRKHYPIPYNLRKFCLYIVLALILFYIGKLIDFENNTLNYILRNALIVCFLLVAYTMEKSAFSKQR